jgi:glycosyltransferase involved in cell wall biosynthesis
LGNNTYAKEWLFMVNSPLVSIVTIVYNGEKYIGDTIKSVIGQTYKNIEYIIIDGGSTDGTLGVIKGFGSSVTSLISEKDEGISDAFNKGVKMAKGEIIGIINADDWYEKDAVEKAVKKMEEADIVYGDMRLWKDGKADFVLKGDKEFIEKEMTVNHPTVFIRRTCYEKFGFFDKDYRCAMDYDLLLRFKVNNCRFGRVPEVLANMRWEGFSDANWLLGCRETLRIKNKYLPARKMENQLYFYKHILAIAIPRFLKKAGLNFVVKFYRSRFSRLKKVYE